MNYVLVTEGSDDKVLTHPINWLLEQHCKSSFSGDWADPSVLDDASRDLPTRIAQVAKFYPADVYFVHRDTDTFDREVRVREIVSAFESAGVDTPYVCTIPVRMTEAWFMFSVQAIRRAADNPSSRVDIRLPSASEIQRRASPKDILIKALIAASELSGRRLNNFSSGIGRRKALVAAHIEDYSPLRSYPAFVDFERELIDVLRANGWA